MGNCLKTKLKEVVNNDNLKVFGAFYLNVAVGNGRFNAALPASSTWKIVGNGTFTDSNYTIPATPVKETTVAASTYIYFHANEPIKIYCIDNYQISALNTGASTNVSVEKSDIDHRTITLLYNANLIGEFTEEGYFKNINGNMSLKAVDGKLNLNVLKGNTNNITSFVFNFTDDPYKVEGDINVFENLNISGNLVLYYTKATGNVSVFGKFTSSPNIILQGSDQLRGTIESVIEGLWTNGKRSGTTIFDTVLTQIKLKNRVYAHGVLLRFSDNLVTVEYPENTIRAKYDGTTWKDENDNPYTPEVIE